MAVRRTDKAESRGLGGGQAKASDLSFLPLTPGLWKDLVELFGPRGACGGCWCMTWRLPRSRFLAGQGGRNRAAFRRVVGSGEPPGILAYRSDGRGRMEPVGWCAVAPREAYSVLARSRVLAPLDERPVWSVSCFFVKRGHRRSGMTVALLRAAAEHVRRRGGRVLEGYPVEPRQDHVPDVFVWTGLSAAFRKAGFREVLRRSPTRPIFRMELGPSAARPRRGGVRPARRG